MKREIFNRKIEGATANGSLTTSEEATHHTENPFNLTSCPAEHTHFIENTSLETLVYWKLQTLFDKFEEDTPGDVLKTILDHVERPLFALILKKTRGNQSKAADVLGCNRNTLHRKLKEFEIEPRDVRQALRKAGRKSRPSHLNHHEAVTETRQ